MSRAGQLFTSDFIVSAVLFFTALGTVFYGVNTALDRQTQQNQRMVLERHAVQLTDLLIRTPGYPPDWNASTVEVPGIAQQDHIIDPEKFIGLRRIGHERLKELARLGGDRLALNLTINGSRASIGGFTDQELALVTDRERLFTDIEHSGADWELYWVGAGAVPASGARDAWSGDAATMMDAALSNRSRYDAIISDGTGLNVSDVPDTDRLARFVDAGGRYVQIGGGSLVTTAGGTAVTDPPASGTVVDDRWLDQQLRAGDDVELEAAPLALSGVAALVNTSAGDCLVCYSGQVLFAADHRLTDASATANGLAGRGMLHDYLFGTNGTMGDRPTADASEIVPRTRPVLVSGQQLRRGSLEVVVWR